MTLFVHIGMQKTGTTSLQISMASERPALEAAGLLYPSGTLGLDDSDANAHHYLAHALMGRSFGHTPDADLALVEQHCARIRAVAAAFAGDTILSSEDLSRIPHVAIPRLRAMLPEDSRVVVYLRRQDYWIDSLYGQSLKFGPGPGIETFLTKSARRLNYRSLLKAWSASFGAENIIVRTYERQARGDLWLDFCSAIGHPEAASALTGNRRHNVSLTRQQIEFLDTAPDPVTRNGLRRLLEQHNRRSDLPEALRHLSAERAAQIMAEQAENNALIARRFLRREALFVDAAPAREDDGKPQDLSALSALFAALPQGVEISAEQRKSILDRARVILRRLEA